MLRYQEIERSIITKYRKDIWSCFIKAVKEFDLIKPNDNLMICISGGKDSFLLAKCIEELQKHGKIPFKAHYVCMDPGYKDTNKKLIKENAKILNIKLEIFDSNIFDTLDHISKNNPCYLCARMRRGYLYNKAKELGCNKIVLGHHYNDVIETTLLSMFYGAEFKTMMPKLHSNNYEGIDLIRPLYYVKEDAIISWAKYNKLSFLNCACSFTEKTANQEQISKRKEIKILIKELKKINPSIEHNILKSTDNVNLNCILGTTNDGEYHSFLENYKDNS